MKSIKAKIKEVEVREKITFKSSGDFMTVYDKQIIEYKDANGKWHKLK